MKKQSPPAKKGGIKYEDTKQNQNRCHIKNILAQ